MTPYRSGRTLAWIVIALAAVRTLHQAVNATSAAVLFRDPRNATALVVTVAMASAFFHLVLLASIVVFLMWVHRSVKNLGALGSQDLTNPADAVWAFFIPFVNLVRPHTILSKLWIESQQQVIDPDGAPVPVSTRIVTAWWVLNVVASFVAMYLIFLVIALKTGAPTIADVERIFATTAIVSAMGAVDGVLFILMTKRIQDRQDAQHADFELRAAVPMPDASVLR